MDNTPDNSQSNQEATIDSTPLTPVAGYGTEVLIHNPDTAHALLVTPDQKKQYDVMPTEKQKTVFRILMENQGISIYQAMLQAGYTPATAKNPSNIRDSKGWEQLLEQHLPDSMLAEKHNLLLNAKRIKRTFVKGIEKEVEESEDTFAISKGLEMAYKLKNKFPATKTEITGKLSLARLIDESTDEE